ncbi:TIGR01777 family oxidoreductase [Actinoalloteichus spitiensis]|uniref:TIGR01777 family oxidoreductase n=1 Tax=Actinoalloteichus spitiensis TaxID=252394 RepID=UPI00036AD8B1|nr:TIGR01777 family oxidoreductase [Actinoalloteichus spitiensis]
MRVVVAGSSGLVGSALVSTLEDAGHEVVRLVRRPATATGERSWDPPAGQVPHDAMEGADAVVNLCGASIFGRRWNHARKQVLRDSRLVPTEVLSAAVAQHRVPVLVNASAVGYYGDTGDRAVDETAPRGSGFLAQLCHDWEDAARPAREAGARVVLARTGIVLSSDGGLLRTLRPLFSLVLGGRLGSGGQYLSWISMDDELAALRFTLERDGVDGPVNLTAPAPVTNAEFTRMMSTVLGRPAPWVVPGVALRALLGQIADELVLTGQRAVPKVLSEHGFQFHHPTLNSALVAALND